MGEDKILHTSSRSTCRSRAPDSSAARKRAVWVSGWATNLEGCRISDTVTVSLILAINHKSRVGAPLDPPLRISTRASRVSLVEKFDTGARVDGLPV